MIEARTILLVDDDAQRAQALAGLLEGEGYRLRIAKSETGAIELLRAHELPVDLLLVDVGLSEALAAQERFNEHDLPLLFLVGKDDAAALAKTRQAAAYGYVFREGGLPLLLAAIDAALRLHERNQSLRQAAERATHAAMAQKAVEEALRESEQRYRILVETADDVIVLTDLDGRHLYHNSAYYTNLGYTSEEEIDLDSMDRVHPDDLPMVRAGLADLMEKGRSTGEYRVMHRDGHWIYRYNKASLVRDAAGKPVAILSIIRDITERKQMEEKLRQNERFFRALVENSYDAITLVDRDGMTIYQSPAVSRLTGYTMAENYRHHALENVHFDDLPKLMETYTRLLANPGCIEHLDFRSIRQDGSIWWAECAVTNMLDDPDIQAIIVNYRDVTERIQAQEAFKTSDARFRAIAEMAGDLIFTLSPEGKVLYVNEMVAQIFNNTPQALVGKGLEEQFPEDMFEQEWGQILAAFAEGKPFHKEYEVRFPHGNEWMETWLTPLRDSSGQMTAIVGDARNITERKRAEERVQTLLREKELLLREVHHRIKNHMNTITSLLNLQSESQENPESKQALKDAAARVRSMMVLYDKLYRSPNYNSLSLREYIPTLVNEVISLFPQKSMVKLEYRVEDIVLPQNVVSALGIILNELATNTMKHAFPRNYEGTITVEAKESDGQITVAFGDEGVGLPEAFTVEHSPGFGMQLVSILVEQIRASLRIERENGTRFILTFPRSPSR